MLTIANPGLFPVKSPPYSDLINQLKGLINPTDYKCVTIADALAVCQQESDCIPVFKVDDPLFAVNLGTAVKTTGLPKTMIGEAITIRKGPYVGQMAKFRLEPSYWDWAQKQRLNSLQMMLMMSCSFGVGQQMMRWAVPAGQVETWTAFVENFKADTGLQLQYLLGNLKKLLDEAEGDLDRAYRGYNSGDINSQNLAVMARAANVVKLRNEIQSALIAG